MTADDLNGIENRLGVSLPAEYRKLITGFPHELTPFAVSQIVDRAMLPGPLPGGQ